MLLFNRPIANPYLNPAVLLARLRALTDCNEQRKDLLYTSTNFAL